MNDSSSKGKLISLPPDVLKQTFLAPAVISRSKFIDSKMFWLKKKVCHVKDQPNVDLSERKGAVVSNRGSFSVGIFKK